MIIKYKSVPIKRSISTTFGTTERITTVYDMSDVRDHVFECPGWKLWLAPRRIPYFIMYFLVTGFVAVFIGLIISKSFPDGPDHIKSSMFWREVTFAVCLVVTVLIAHGMSIEVITEEKLDEHAYRERGPENAVRLKVVTEGNWPAFLKSLERRPY